MKYTDRIKQACYDNSCDCLYFGYGFSYLNKCGLPEDEARTIWEQAKNDMGNSL